MNYYQTAAFNKLSAQMTANGKPLTILPFGVYNEYEQQFKETFIEITKDKKYLDSIIYESIYNNEALSNESTSNEESINSNEESINEEQPINDAPSIEPLPGFEPDENVEPNPGIRLQMLMKQLHDIAEIRDDIDQFIMYLSERYNINLNEPLNDLPFEVIDEILTYIDYDPDRDGEIELNTSESSDDEIIIPVDKICEFQNTLNRFRFNIKTMKHLDKLNGITDERIDDEYYKFQSIFKPMIASLIILYKTNYRDYLTILRDSINYHEKRRQND